MEAQTPAFLPAGSMRKTLLEFCGALRVPFTYSPRRNPELLFGFLWGIPVPIFAFAIHLHGSSVGWSVAACTDVLYEHPLYLFFILHPLLFAVVFGALGTMRAHREQRIRFLLETVERHCQELSIANEQLKDLDRLKTEFLANVTHELRSPLVTAIGYSDRILAGHLGPLTERQEKALQISQRSLARLQKLIGELLDLSRLESGIARFAMAQTDLREVVEEARESLLPKAQEKKIELSATFTTPGPIWLWADRAKMLQVVLNLADNAIKFSPPNTRVRIGIYAEDSVWHLRVADEGPGIPGLELPKLFTRFHQTDGSLARTHEGMGLGLVLVKKIVEAHGGQVWIESQLGAGTQVHATLPTVENFRAATKRRTHEEVTHA